MSITAQNAQINVTFNGMLVISTADRTFVQGFAGAYAKGQALFDDLVFSVACSQVCTGMTDGTTCTFGCQEGLLAVGPLSRTCQGVTGTPSFNPDLVAQPLYCTVPAPTFVPSTLLSFFSSSAICAVMVSTCAVAAL